VTFESALVLTLDQEKNETRNFNPVPLYLFLNHQDARYAKMPQLREVGKLKIPIYSAFMFDKWLADVYRHGIHKMQPIKEEGTAKW